MKPTELRYYASQLASLTVSATRATPEQLSEIHGMLEETFLDALTLLAHDAERRAAATAEETTTTLARELLSRISSISRTELRA